MSSSGRHSALIPTAVFMQVIVRKRVIGVFLSNTRVSGASFRVSRGERGKEILLLLPGHVFHRNIALDAPDVVGISADSPIAACISDKRETALSSCVLDATEQRIPLLAGYRNK